MPDITFDRCEGCQRAEKLTDGRCDTCRGAQISMGFSANYHLKQATEFTAYDLGRHHGVSVEARTGAGRVVLHIQDSLAALSLIEAVQEALGMLRGHTVERVTADFREGDQR